MKCRWLFSGKKNKKNILKYRPLTFLPSMLSVKGKWQRNTSSKCYSTKTKNVDSKRLDATCVLEGRFS